MEAEAVYAYEKEHYDELNLNVGDIIHNVKQINEAGWSEGELNGVRGKFPDNFVKLRPANTQAAPPAINTSIDNLQDGEPEKKPRLARVLYSYEAQDDCELTLEVDQIVEILDEEDEGWSKGRIGKKEGLFPNNYVEEEGLEVSKNSAGNKTKVQDPFDKLEQCRKSLKIADNEMKRKQEYICVMEKQITEFVVSHNKLCAKLKKYEALYDESWLKGSRSSLQSLRVDRSEVKKNSHQYIGAGRWGSVYSGKFQGEKVAIKHAHQELLHVQGIVDVIKREISIMAHIRHPNLVRFIGAVFDREVEAGKDVPIILLELMDMNLRTGYTSETFSRSTMISIFSDVAYALHYLHEQITPIIHRDINAPNVLLKRLGNKMFKAKVSDFGAANLASQSKTASAEAIIYTPPEMLPQEDISAAHPEQTVKVDIYSYGVLLLEVICGEIPVLEKRHSLLQRCESNWENIHTIVTQCTSQKPAERPTMREILKFIEQIKP